MQNLLLRNGTLIDGTGRRRISGDLLIRGDRIAEVGSFAAPAEAQVIDCAGLVVAPGFIDAHSHSDLQVLADRWEKCAQGVTTEVVGNCGFSAYPAPRDPSQLRQFANGIFCGDDHWAWPSAQEYLAAVSYSPMVSVASLVGHGSLRIAVAGHKLGRLSESEMQAMEELLAEAFAAGACGFSTGLMYAPGSSAPPEELERLCRVAARHGKIHASHIRSYFSDLVAAVDEQIELARRTGCRAQISHLQAVGAANWSQQAPAIEHIEKARQSGIDIGFDCYPYTAGSTVLTQLLPQWVLDGGIDGMLARLSDLAERAFIAREIEGGIAWGWSDILISAVSSRRNQDTVGKSLAAIAARRDCQPVDAMLDLLLEEHGDVNMLSFNQSEDNLRVTITHPLSIIISDGFYVRGRPHPRLYGTFPRLLGMICREQGWLEMEEAIRKVTDAPAIRFDLRNRGRLARGYFADVTVFDAAAIGSPATYEEPDRPPVGIRYVLRNGQILQAATRP